MRPVPITIVATYRPSDAQITPERAHLIAEIANGPRSTVHTLAGLSESEGMLLLAGIASAPDVAHDIYIRSSGNPLFLLHLAAAVDTLGVEAVRRDGARLPEALRDAIGLQVSSVSKSTREALSMAAVVGREFSLEVLRCLVPDAGRMLAALDEALLLGLVAHAPDHGIDWYRFKHVLVRDFLYETLGGRERAETHVLLSGHVARTDHSVGRAALLAYHDRAAVPLVGREPAIHSTVEAAAAASARFAYLDAAMQYRLALDLTSGQPNYRRLECECYIGLAESLMRPGIEAALGQRAPRP